MTMRIRPQVLAPLAAALLLAGNAAAQSNCQTCLTMNSATYNGSTSQNVTAIAIEVAAVPQTLQICSVDLFMAALSTSVAMNVSIYGAGGPWATNALAKGSVTVTRTPMSYRTYFGKPAVVPANTVFYIVFDQATQVWFPVSTSGTIVPHHIYAVGWAGPYSNSRWNYVIGCGIASVAQYSTYGAGCPSSAPPFGASSGRAVLGQTFTAELFAARPSVPVAHVLGASQTFWGTTPLPLDLTPLGAPGCNVLASADLVLGTTTSALQGRASIPFLVPQNVGLLGLSVYHQFFVLDPLANAFGLAVTNAGKATIGEV